MKRKIIIISVIAVLSIMFISIIGVSFASLSGMNFKEIIDKGAITQYHYKDDSINALLNESKDKTVKDDIVKTVTPSLLYNAFGFYGITTKGKLSSKSVSAVADDGFLNIMSVEPNGFLKENQFGELYTAFKTDEGDYIYIIMSVTREELNGETVELIRFDRAYWVYQHILTRESFDSLIIGETTPLEGFAFTGIERMQQEMRKAVGGGFQPYSERLTCFQNKMKQGNVSNNDLDYIVITTPCGNTVLTTTGIMTVKYEYSEAVGMHVVTAMEFKEGCPINPEDLI